MRSLGIREYRQEKWKRDIESYYRWKRFYDMCISEDVRSMVQDRMNKIKERWPEHAKHFD